jgi:hypothetical protein
VGFLLRECVEHASARVSSPVALTNGRFGRVVWEPLENLTVAPLLSQGRPHMGKPTEDEALRVLANLATPDGKLAPADMVAQTR